MQTAVFLLFGLTYNKLKPTSRHVLTCNKVDVECGKTVESLSCLSERKVTARVEIMSEDPLVLHSVLVWSRTYSWNLLYAWSCFLPLFFLVPFALLLNYTVQPSRFVNVSDKETWLWLFLWTLALRHLFKTNQCDNVMIMDCIYFNITFLFPLFYAFILEFTGKFRQWPLVYISYIFLLLLLIQRGT